MHALTITKHGGRGVLAVRELSDPLPGPGEVRLRVAAAGLNFAEVTARQGLYPDAPPPPCVVGYEAAGTVDAVGPGATAFSVGDRAVALTRFGGQASVLCVPEVAAFPVRDGLDLAVAAAIPVTYLTAHHMLFHIGNVRPDQTVLLHMAGGGVGTAVLQLLQTVPGVVVFGTASARKHDALRALGCAHPIDHRSVDYVRAVRDVVGTRGVDLVLDPLGGKDWRSSWDLLAPAGRMVAFGLASAIGGERRNLLRVLRSLLGTPWINPIQAMNSNRSLQGVHMGRLWDEIPTLRYQMERILALEAEGIVRPVVHARVPFSQAAEAHRMLEEGENVGKVVLIPDEA